MNVTRLCIAAAVAIAAVLPMPSFAGESTDARANQLPLRFKDANGKVVGRAAWGLRYGNSFIIMQEGKQTFSISVYAPIGGDSALMQFSGAPVYYESTDCSGQAYLNKDYEESLQGLHLATVLISGNGQTSILVATGPYSQVQSQSYRQLDFPCYSSSYPIFGVPVTDTIDITGKYQPPFSIH